MHSMSLKRCGYSLCCVTLTTIGDGNRRRLSCVCERNDYYYFADDDGGGGGDERVDVDNVF